jgi:sterol desaturase/sphingolipid hydroxylase (fatty acid hydroxylase superfamily)
MSFVRDNSTKMRGQRIHDAKHSMWITVIGQVLSFTTYYLFYVQPGIDRKAWMKSILDSFPAAPAIPLYVFGNLMMQLPHFLCVGFYMLLYWLNWPFFEQFRVDKSRPWGWNSPNPKEREEYRDFVRKGLRWFLKKRYEEFVFVLVLACAAVVSGRLSTPKQIQYLIDSTPSWQESTFQLLVGCVMWDGIYYFAHRLQHATPWMYKWHKIHHEAVRPTASHGVWGDDKDGILGVLLPVLAPAFFFRMHFWTFICWVQIHAAHTYFDHSGYDLPYSPFQLIPFGSRSRAHYFHHSHNMGNYGVYFPIWDWMFGTDKAYKQFEEARVQNELEQEQSQPRPRKHPSGSPQLGTERRWSL